MKQTFRQSMAWLHTWTGLVVGWILFFVFLTGTAGYATNELNRWMQPEKPLNIDNLPTISQQFNSAFDWYTLHPEAQAAERWSFHFATNQRGVDEFHLRWQAAPTEIGQSGHTVNLQFDPYTKKPLLDQHIVRSTGGGDTLYRMHYDLRYIPYQQANLLIGICTMFMLVAIITGIITHKKIFKDFFTFRPAKGQRSWLDAHLLFGVLALPFHIMITYSGFMFFLITFIPYSVPLLYGNNNVQVYQNELFENGSSNLNAPDHYDTESIKHKAEHIKSLVAETEARWGAYNLYRVHINHSKNNHPATLEMIRVAANRQGIMQHDSYIKYDLSNFQQLDSSASNNNSIPRNFNKVMIDLHEGHYANPLQRWVYFFMGLIGSGMIATGLILWSVKRRPKANKLDMPFFPYLLIEKLNIGFVAGLPFAIAIYFWANRLIPVEIDGRAVWEVHCMFIAWLMVFIYVIFRPIMFAWREILALASLSFLLIPILNILTTEQHILKSIAYQNWVLVNVEVGFIIVGMILALATWKVHKRIKQPISVNTRTNSIARLNIQANVPKLTSFKKLKLKRNLNIWHENTKYRWMVFSRCFLAVIVGFLIANLSVPIIALIFYEQKALATYSGLMMSFAIWTLIILYIFSATTAKRAWLVVSSSFVIMAGCYLFLKWLRL